MFENKFNQVKPVQQPRVNPIIRLGLALSLAASGALGLVKPSHAESTPPGSASGTLEHKERAPKPDAVRFAETLQRVINNHSTQTQPDVHRAEATGMPGDPREAERQAFADAITEALQNDPALSPILQDADFQRVLHDLVRKDYLAWDGQEIQCYAFASLLAVSLKHLHFPQFTQAHISDASELIPTSMYDNGKPGETWYAKGNPDKQMSDIEIMRLETFDQIKQGDCLVFMVGTDKGHIGCVLETKTGENGEHVIVFAEANRDLQDENGDGTLEVVTDGKIYINELNETQFNQRFTKNGGSRNSDAINQRPNAAVNSGEVFILRTIQEKVQLVKMEKSPFQTPTSQNEK